MILGARQSQEHGWRGLGGVFSKMETDNVVWALFTAIATQGATFLSAVATARILGKAAFGEFSFVQLSVLALANVASLGLGIAATKQSSELGNSDPMRLGSVLGLFGMMAGGVATCVAVLVFSFAGPIGRSLAGSPLSDWAIRAGSVFVFFALLSQYQQGAIVGLEEFRRLAKVGFTTAGLTLVVVPALSAGYGATGGISGLAMVAAIGWLLQKRLMHSLIAERGGKITVVRALDEAGMLARFALPAAAAGVVPPLAAWWGNFHLSTLPHGMDEIATFSAANSLRVAVLFAPGLISRVASPYLNRIQANAGRLAFRQQFWKSLFVTVGTAMIPAAILAVLAKPLLQAFGKDFSNGVLVARVLLVAAVAEAIALGAFQRVFVKSNFWWQFGTTLAWGGTLLGLMLFAFHAEGAQGLAKSYVGAWVISIACYSCDCRLLKQEFRRGSST